MTPARRALLWRELMLPRMVAVLWVTHTTGHPARFQLAGARGRGCTGSDCPYGTSPWNSVNGHGLAPAAVMIPSTCELSDGPLYEGRQPLSKAMIPVTPPADVRRVANESVPKPLSFAAAQPPEPA